MSIIFDGPLLNYIEEFNQEQGYSIQECDKSQPNKDIGESCESENEYQQEILNQILLLNGYYHRPKKSKSIFQYLYRYFFPNHFELLVESNQQFDDIYKQSIRFIKEMELLSRGYRLSSPLGPIERIERNTRINTCHDLRSLLLFHIKSITDTILSTTYSNLSDLDHESNAMFETFDNTNDSTEIQSIKNAFRSLIQARISWLQYFVIHGESRNFLRTMTDINNKATKVIKNYMDMHYNLMRLIQHTPKLVVHRDTFIDIHELYCMTLLQIKTNSDLPKSAIAKMLYHSKNIVDTLETILKPNETSPKIGKFQAKKEIPLDFVPAPTKECVEKVELNWGNENDLMAGGYQLGETGQTLNPIDIHHSDEMLTELVLVLKRKQPYRN